MRNEIPTTDEVRYALAQTLRMGNACLRAARKPALISAGSLIVIWCVARIMEAVYAKSVFDMTATYWFGLVVWMLMALWLAGTLIVSTTEFKTMPNKKAAGFSWALFLAFAVMVLLGMEGFGIASSGLLAVLSGSPETSAQNTFLLFKYHSLNPMLAINVAVLKLTGQPWDVHSLAPYVWRWNALLTFFIWSCSCGILLLIKKGQLGLKFIHLSLSIIGLAALIFLKSASKSTTELLIIFQAASPVLLIFQILLFYASIRNAISEKKETEISKSYSNHFPSEDPGPLTERKVGFPPSAIMLAVFVFLMFPILADLETRFELAVSSNRIIDEISKSQANQPSRWISVAPISIRSGPAFGDDIIGILPKGTRVRVQDNRINWVNIGDNRWVQEKFLRPVKSKNVASSGQSGKG